jgi:hypothetical protein
MFSFCVIQSPNQDCDSSSSIFLASASAVEIKPAGADTKRYREAR